MKFGKYNLEIIVVALLDTNCYILSQGNDAIVVDAPGDGEIISQYLKNHGLNLNAILITHGHFDHIEALDLLHREYPNGKIYMSAIEKEVIDDNVKSLMDHDLDDVTKSSIIYLDNGAIINELGLDIKMISTPGHTIGSSCFYIKELNILFSGDTLFKDTYGRTDLPTSDTKAMARSVGITLMELDDGTEVFPGHGSKTSIGHERKFNELTRDYVIKWALNDK